MKKAESSRRADLYSRYSKPAKYETNLFAFSNPSTPPLLPHYLPTYRNNVEKPRGAHDYYNVMWDPRIRRGGDPGKLAHPSQRAVTSKATDEVKRVVSQQGRGRRRSRKGASKVKLLKSSRSPMTMKEYMRIGPGPVPKFRPETPLPVPGRSHCSIQTDLCIEQFNTESEILEACTQTVALYDIDLVPMFQQSKTGEDQDTQIYPGDIFDLAAEIKPIAATVVELILKQALIEVMEEEELMTIQLQQSLFDRKYRHELAGMEEAKGRVKNSEDQLRRIEEFDDEEFQKQREAGNLVGALHFASAYLKDLPMTVTKDWLDRHVVQEVGNAAALYQLVDELIREAAISVTGQKDA